MARRDGHVVIDVGHLVDHVCRLIRADPRLRSRLDTPRRAGAGAASAVDPLHAAVTSLVASALTGQIQYAAAFVTYLRDRAITADDYDRFGHYLLSTALSYRVGAERLIAFGATLTLIRAAVLPQPAGELGGPGYPRRV